MAPIQYPGPVAKGALVVSGDRRSRVRLSHKGAVFGKSPNTICALPNRPSVRASDGIRAPTRTDLTYGEISRLGCVTTKTSCAGFMRQPHAKGEASSGQRVSCNDVPLGMRLLTREWHALGERSMDDPEYE